MALWADLCQTSSAMGGGSAHSPQRACASETFPPLRTLDQVLVPGMRGLAARALA